MVGLRANSSDDGFARALEPRTFQFPADHGPHPEFQTEWWYYTGNLETDAGRHFDGAQYRHFGYQLTFFRRALTPTAPVRTSDWGTNQVYMAQLAITDVAGGRFHNFERLSRGAAGLAGATGTPYHVWLESWSIEETAPGVVRLRAAEGDVKLDLTLRPLKPPALHGQAGLSGLAQRI